MIEIRKIDAAHCADANIPNEPFELTGRMVPALSSGVWSYTIEPFDAPLQDRFPDFPYDVGAETSGGKNGRTVFFGAYDGDVCVGLAVLREAMFRYLYLDDLKVSQAYRGKGIGGRLVEACMNEAERRGKQGVYTVAQDNNLRACLFYLGHGFEIGGFNNRDYRGTVQENKADLYFYRNALCVSVATMRDADRRTIESGVPSKELMRRAAQGVYDAYDGWTGKRTLVICGSGNNGGDGYALAEIMRGNGLDVTVLRVSEKFSADGQYYYDRCMKKGVPYLLYGKDAVEFGEYGIFVDCMLGTGFQGVPKAPVASVIREINRAHEEHGAYVVAVDINSGMNGDTGEGQLAVVSDLTVSIGFYKTGMFRGRAGELIGDMTNVDIGIRL
ncbi:MAG: NAD(P)H-hydrate epimerase [Clostridiales bacterium]|nr:NAD(P)H-hydrate epimerase [Clostridiales bacterium]